MGKFQYKPRDASSTVERSKQQSSLFDIMTKEGLPTWTPKAGDHSIRFLPPTHENAQHWAIDVWVHSNVGPDSQSYLCLAKMKGESCPVCEEIEKAKSNREEERAKSLKAYKRVMGWIIPRSEEKDGPRLWTYGMTLDKDIAACCIDKRTNEVLAIDDPENGYDVDFTREGTTQQNTKYVGVRIARRSTTLADKQVDQDRWLEFVVNNPLTSCLNFYDYDHIMAAFSGVSRKEKKEAESRETKPVTTRSESAPAVRPTSSDTKVEPTRTTVPTNTAIDAPFDVDKPKETQPASNTPASSAPSGEPAPGSLRARIRAGLGGQKTA